MLPVAYPLVFILATIPVGLFVVILVWLWRGLFRQPEILGWTELPRVCVIVAARNEESNLPNLLTALRQQTYPSDLLKIVIVNDNSTDGTEDLVQGSARWMPNLELISLSETPSGWGPKKWALQCGIKATTAEIILTTDADCKPTIEWVEAVVNYFGDPRIGMVMGPAPLVRKDLNIVERSIHLDAVSLDSLAAAGSGHGLALTCTGRNLAYRRGAFEEIGGFGNIAHYVSGDDDLLMHKMANADKWKIVFALTPKAAVPSPPPEGLEGFIRQRLRHASKGKAYYDLGAKLYFRLLLPTIYIANLASAAGLVIALVTLDPYWLAPLAIKLMAEALVVYTYINQVGERVSPGIFLLTGVLHHFYVVLIGLVGNFVPVEWKGRAYKGNNTAGESGNIAL
jgi:cellulose synthase/poly-beta-1,6-N-acetylglucosamine synthase-like glycosyltransferase